jgi:hypothetical protein
VPPLTCLARIARPPREINRDLQVPPLVIIVIGLVPRADSAFMLLCTIGPSILISGFLQALGSANRFRAVAWQAPNHL